MIQFRCSCGKTLAVREQDAGKKVRCPNCGSIHVSPGAEPAAEPPVAEPVRGPKTSSRMSKPKSRAREPAQEPPPPAVEETKEKEKPAYKPAFRRPQKRWCYICGKPIEGDEKAHVCPGCGKEYHPQCWKQRGGCAIYGCQYHSDKGEGGAGAPQAVYSPEEEKASFPLKKLIVLLIFLIIIGGGGLFGYIKRDRLKQEADKVVDKVKAFIDRISTPTPTGDEEEVTEEKAEEGEAEEKSADEEKAGDAEGAAEKGAAEKKPTEETTE